MAYTEDETHAGKWVVRGIVAVVVLILIAWLWPFASVDAGNVGIVSLFGKVENNQLSPGLHVINPLAHVTEMSNQTQTINETGQDALEAASNDLQDVKIESVVNYHIPAATAQTVFVQYQGLSNFQTNKLEPTVREAVKAVAAQYTAEELVTERAQVSSQIEANIVTQFQQLGVVEESFKMTNLTFSDQFNAAIEAKATAVQDALTAENKVVQTQAEASSTIISAQAQAEAIQIQATAINSQGGADYVELQAINKWNGVLPAQMVPGSTVPFINLNK